MHTFAKWLYIFGELKSGVAQSPTVVGFPPCGEVLGDTVLCMASFRFETD